METLQIPGASHPDHHRGLRTVATIEAVKGVLALIVGFAFVEILRRDVDLQDAALNLLYVLHIDPDRRIAIALLHAAQSASEASVFNVAAIVLVYASLRFLESYGLWRQRIWAEWLAIISGAIYLPFELRALIRHPTAFHWAILLINIVIVLYIVYVRWEDIQQRHRRERAHGAVVAEDGD
jgi:uncharacterized membrane protein (DUF2068 family)